ncbi:TlpA disulfide reductase family protein [Bradyrhizobium sp. USDA 3458]|uniref:TlpA disulfide reductase family protein n=1 Tax=Bradyrhizobium sp. USDA 3458 TaxID=2591461 RepID=UPI001144BE69|nr:TlpA disulfide reductase family protein [Bradyrhizobium sp. USDA 3458]
MVYGVVQALAVLAQATAALTIGDPAPPLAVESWVRGQPLTNFENGKVYVVEFFSSRCGPCGKEMSHLVQIQNEYRDRGVEVIGVSTGEPGSTIDVAKARFDSWLNTKAPNLNYRIAFNYTGEMNDKLWMKPSSSRAIPTSFVIDRDGRIALIDHPRRLDALLPKILEGKWRGSDEAKAAEAERIVRNDRFEHKFAMLRELRSAEKSENWTAALSIIEQALAAEPDDIFLRAQQADLLLHKMHDVKGPEVMRRLVRDAVDQNSELWMMFAIDELFGQSKDNSDFPSAERLAMGKDLSERILKLNPPTSGGLKVRSYEAVAEYYHAIGNKERAIELVDLTLRSLGSPDAIEEDWKEAATSRLVRTMARYKSENVCYGRFCADPNQASPESNRKG